MQSNKIVSEGILASYSVWQFAPYGHPQPVGPTASIPVTEKATFLNLTRKGGFTDIYKPKKTYTFNRDATLYLNGECIEASLNRILH